MVLVTSGSGGTVGPTVPDEPVGADSQASDQEDARRQNINEQLTEPLEESSASIAAPNGSIDVEKVTKKTTDKTTDEQQDKPPDKSAPTEVVIEKTGGEMGTPKFVTPSQKKEILEQQKTVDDKFEDTPLGTDAIVTPEDGMVQVTGPGADPTTFGEVTGISEFEEAQGVESDKPSGGKFQTTVAGAEFVGTKPEIASKIESEWLKQNPQFDPQDVRVVETDSGFQTQLTQSGARSVLEQTRAASDTDLGQLAYSIEPTAAGIDVGLTGRGQEAVRSQAAEQIEDQLSTKLTPEQRAAAGGLGATPDDIQQIEGVDVDLSQEDIKRQDGRFVLSESGLAAVGAARLRQQGLDVTETDIKVTDGQVSLSAAASRDVAAEQLSDRLGTNVQPSDVVRTDNGWQLSDSAQRRYAAEQISERVGQTVASADLKKTDEGWTLSDQAERKIVTNQLREQTGMAIAASDLVRTDKGWKLTGDAEKRLAAKQLSEKLGFTVTAADIKKTKDGNFELKTEGVTPHVAMVAGQEALVERARRERGIEETFESVVSRARGEVGEFAESPLGFATGVLASGGLTSAEAASVQFQLAEQIERVGQDVAEGVKEGGVEAGQEATEFIFGDPDPLGAPTVSGQTLGEAAAGAAAGAISVPFQLAGAVGQYPVTAGMDIQELQDAEFEITGETPATRRIETTADTPTVAAGGLTGATARGGKRTLEYFADRPLEAAFLFAPVAISGARGGGAALARGRGPIGRTAGRIPRPGISRFAVGEGTGRSLVLRTTEGKVATERPLVTARRGGPGRTIETGTPKIRLTEEPITPELRPAETRALETRLKELEGGVAEAQRIRSFRETQRQTQFSQLKPKELESTVADVLESHGVPRSAAKQVVRQVKADEGAVYGSVTQRAAAKRIGEPGVTRTPRDIDIADVPSKSRFSREIVRKINEEAGYEVVELRDGTPVSKITGEKLFDIHEAEVPTSESGAVSGEEIFGVRREPDITTTEGLKTTTLSEQTARKGSGSMFQITRDPRGVGELRSRITPEHPGRLKDIADFYAGERANIRALEMRGRTKRAQRARENLERFIESFGEDIATRVRQQYEQAGEPSAALAEFGETTRPSSISAALESPAVAVSSLSTARSTGIADVSRPSVAVSESVSRPSRASASFGFGIQSPSIGSMGVSRSSPTVRSAVSQQPSGVASRFISPTLSVGISSPRSEVSVPGSTVSGPSVPSTSIGVSSPSRSLSLPRYPVSTPRTAPPSRPRKEEESRKRKREEPSPDVPIESSRLLNVGWLTETQLGFAGIDVQSTLERTGQEELEEQAEGLGGFTFELLPALSVEQAEELEATQEFFFSR